MIIISYKRPYVANNFIVDSTTISALIYTLPNSFLDKIYLFVTPFFLILLLIQYFSIACLMSIKTFQSLYRLCRTQIEVIVGYAY